MTGFWRYARFILRRERATGAIWLISLFLAVAALAAAYPTLFPNPTALLSMQLGLNTPAMVAMMGPVYGLDRLTPAIAMAQQCLIWLAMATVVMNIFFVNRHTRRDEELGRLEMLAALPVGRLAAPGATIACALLMDGLLSLASALAVLGLNIPGTTVAGAFCYAFSMGMQGFVFAAITLLAAQLFGSAHATSAFSFSMMGLFYILRALGDMQKSALSLLSPLGLGLKVSAFYGDALWPVALLLLEGVAVACLALCVGARRDIGSGLLPARAGRAHAGPLLGTPLGLAWRLTRKSALIWAIAAFLLSASYGSVVGELDSFVQGNDTIKLLLYAFGGGGATLAQAFIPMVNTIMGMLLAVPVIGTVARLGTEERRGRLEQIYAKAVPRGAMFLSFAAISTAQALALSALGALGLYATAAATGIVTLPSLLAASLVQVPPMLVLAGLAALLLGLSPRLLPLTWAMVGYSFVVLYFGRIFDLPPIFARISPFGSVPLMPIEPFAPVPVAILLALAIALFAAGYALYGRRDIG